MHVFGTPFASPPHCASEGQGGCSIIRCRHESASAPDSFRSTRSSSRSSLRTASRSRSRVRASAIFMSGVPRGHIVTAGNWSESRVSNCVKSPSMSMKHRNRADWRSSYLRGSRGRIGHVQSDDIDDLVDHVARSDEKDDEPEGFPDDGGVREHRTRNGLHSFNEMHSIFGLMRVQISLLI